MSVAMQFKIQKLEQDCIEYVLSIDALQKGLGGRAGVIYQRCVLDVYPMLVREKGLLNLYVPPDEDVFDPTVEPCPPEKWAAVLAPQEERWLRCLSELQDLWLSYENQQKIEVTT